MHPLITVMPVNTQVAVIAWDIYRICKGGAPGGCIGQIDAPTKEAAESVAKLLYGDNIAAEAQPHTCPHCGEFLPCSGSTWGCILPQSDGNYPWP